MGVPPPGQFQRGDAVYVATEETAAVVRKLERTPEAQVLETKGNLIGLRAANNLGWKQSAGSTGIPPLESSAQEVALSVPTWAQANLISG